MQLESESASIFILHLLRLSIGTGIIPKVEKMTFSSIVQLKWITLGKMRHEYICV